MGLWAACWGSDWIWVAVTHRREGPRGRGKGWQLLQPRPQLLPLKLQRLGEKNFLRWHGWTNYDEDHCAWKVWKLQTGNFCPSEFGWFMRFAWRIVLNMYKNLPCVMVWSGLTVLMPVVFAVCSSVTPVATAAAAAAIDASFRIATPNRGVPVCSLCIKNRFTFQQNYNNKAHPTLKKNKELWKNISDIWLKLIWMHFWPDKEGFPEFQIESHRSF